jgi:hypothetical protein
MIPSLAGCPLDAERRNHLDVACAVMEQWIRGALPEGLAGIIAELAAALGLEIPGGIGVPPAPEEVPRYLAWLDQVKADIAAEIRAGCPCASGR